MKHYFDDSLRQLNTAITMPISTVIGPMMDQVVVLLIGLPPSTPNPWSAQITPNAATINPTANVTTKPVLIWGHATRRRGVLVDFETAFRSVRGLVDWVVRAP
jgi:hypothetical protein